MTNSWKIVFAQKLFEEMNNFLFSTTPYENGCFLLGQSYRTRNKKNVVVITKMIKPHPGSWRYNGEDFLSPTSTFINQAVTNADENDSCLFFIHTHPKTTHPPSFSYIDKKTNSELFENLSRILKNPIGSLVLSRKGIDGVIYEGGKQIPLSRFFISGHMLFELSAIKKNSPKLNKIFDRQCIAIGRVNQLRLQKLTVSIIGVGGTGSAVAVQLARMGVGTLQIFDKDIITTTNLPRVYGSCKTDCGKPKVYVIMNHIKSFSQTKVHAFYADITKDNMLPALLDSDVIFACTDNLSSRAILNDISLQYFIPMIDVGCRIDLDKTNNIFQAIIKTQIVTPDDACLWCTGALNAKTILQESLNDNEKIKLAEEGYYTPIEDQPSIISMTTMAACIGTNKLLSLLGIFGTNYNSVTQIELKDNFMIDNNPKIREDCVCHKRKGLAGRRKVIAI